MQRESIAAFVREKLLAEQARIASQAGPDRPFDLNVGQWVYLSTENLTCKQLAGDKRLRQRWIGPYVILEKIGNRTFGLDLPRQWQVTNRFDIDRLKPCLDDSLPDMTIEVTEDGTTHVLHEVEAIRAHEDRGRGAQRYMHQGVIRWRGYGADFDEVQPVSWLIQEIPHLLRDYVRTNSVRLSPVHRQRLERALQNDASGIDTNETTRRAGTRGTT